MFRAPAARARGTPWASFTSIRVPDDQIGLHTRVGAPARGGAISPGSISGNTFRTRRQSGMFGSR